jgi:hypothetical protein
VEITNRTLNLFLTACLAVYFIQACGFPADSGGDQTKNPQTKILDIEVQPDTVAPGDTASFTCIIEDSTDNRFKFYWVIDAGEIIGAEKAPGENDQFISDSSHVKWIAPNETNYYTLGVFVTNGSKDSVGVREGFSIEVE